MPVPKEWPTEEQIGRMRRDLYAHNQTELSHPADVQWLNALNAADFALRVRPQLGALVDELDEWARTAAANKDAIAGTFVGLSYRLNEIIAHEEHEETQG